MGTGETIIPQIDIYGTGKNTSSGSLDFAFGYCYMMGGTTGVVTYIYRKYGNIWAGVIPAAMSRRPCDTFRIYSTWIS